MNKKMVVAIQDNRIRYINYDESDNSEICNRYAKTLKNEFMEVYIVEVDPEDKEFIEEIKSNGISI